jgi:hypothetical protein
MFKKGPELSFGLTGGWSGTSNLSNEELARNEVFYHVKRSGALTYMGRQPDIRTSEGAVLGFHQLTGDLRVVNSYVPGLSDAQVIERFRPNIRQALRPEDAALLTRAVMKTGAGEAASSTMSSVRKIVRGARRMPKI